jgi:hypothetical protein
MYCIHKEPVSHLLNDRETIIQMGITIIFSQIYYVTTRNPDAVSLFPFKKSYCDYLKKDYENLR